MPYGDCICEVPGCIGPCVTRAKSDRTAVDKAKTILSRIVCTEGEDRGVVLLDNEGRTNWDEERQCHVYVNDNFSPLGDALIELWDALTQPH